MFGVSFSAVEFDAQHDSEDVRAGGTQQETTLHDQQIRFFETRLNATYGLTENITVEAVVPLRAIDLGIVYRDLSGQPVTLAEPDIHHRNETLTGVFDPWLLAGHRWTFGKWRLAVKAGATIPLGKTEEDPFALGDQGMEHQHIQFGTGTFAPVAVVNVRYQFPKWAVSGFAMTVQRLYENNHGFMPGDRYIAGATASSALGTKGWRFQLGTTFQAETREKWAGTVRTEEGNQGRIDFLASARITRTLSKTLQAFAGVQVPVYNRVLGGQLNYPAIGNVGITARFDLAGGKKKKAEPDKHDHGDEDGHDHGKEDKHDHGEKDKHDHGKKDKHDHGKKDPHAGHDHGKALPKNAWTGVDMIEIAKNGEAAPLTPVAGKITVFDFWATWCKPCKKLDKELIALAKKYPNRIAIRKLNIIDWDSKATAKYLTPGKFNLPHLKVFDKTGKKRFEQSGDPAKLVKKLRELLTP